MKGSFMRAAISKGILSILLVSWVVSAVALADDDMPERLSLGFSAGLMLPPTIDDTTYSAFPVWGLALEYRFIPFVSVGISGQESLFLYYNNTAPLLFEIAVMPQILFHLGDFYAGLRGGVNLILDSFGSISTELVGLVFGPKIGYQYHLPGRRFAIGPELNMLFMSSATRSDPTTTITLPAHQTFNIVIVGKWWF
jgi:hypothetical protein